MTDERFALSGGIYSVPLGQIDPSTFTLTTGSLDQTGQYILIEKEKHVFDTELGAANFILEIGIENITTYYEHEIETSPGIIKIQYVIEVINHPTFEIDAVEKNFEPKLGYRVEVFQEDHNHLVKMDREIIENPLVGLLSDPFLRYFDIKDKS